MDNRFAIATCFYPGVESTPELWKTFIDGGVTDAEIDIPGGISMDKMLATAETLWKDLKAAGVAPTSIHLPFSRYLDVSVTDEAQREYVKAMQKILIKWAGEHEVGIAILHPSSEPIAEEDRPARLAIAAASIKELGEYAAACGVTVAVEDLPRTCLGNCGDDMLKLIGNGEFVGVGICFDINHLLKESHKDFVEKVGKYFITTHFSDYDRLDEKHWFPGDGCIDWKELKELLDSVDYKGRYLFELSNNKSPSLNRPYTPAELIAKFKELTA